MWNFICREFLDSKIWMGLLFGSAIGARDWQALTFYVIAVLAGYAVGGLIFRKGGKNG